MSVVVVTGVSGGLGQRVAASLAARPDVERIVGIDVVPFSSPDPKIEVHTMDLASAGDGLAAAVAGASAVLHLAWLTPDAPGADRDDQRAAATTNRQALARVLEAASSANVNQFVHLSSATVYGAWPDNKIPLTEDDRLRPNPEFAFAVSKADAERVVSEWGDDHPGVRVAILRPAVTVGADGRPLYRALGVTGSPRSGDGGRPVQYLHIEDLAAAVVLAWSKGLSGVYNVAADAGIEEREARALTGGLANVTLPSRLAEIVSALGWEVLRRGVPVEARAYSTQPWVVAADRLKAAGWTPEYTSEEALVATDDRVHWDDLPPGRRQNYNLVIILAAVAGVVAAGGGAFAAIRRRRPRH